MGIVYSLLTDLCDNLYILPALSLHTVSKKKIAKMIVALAMIMSSFSAVSAMMPASAQRLKMQERMQRLARMEAMGGGHRQLADLAMPDGTKIEMTDTRNVSLRRPRRRLVERKSTLDRLLFEHGRSRHMAMNNAPFYRPTTVRGNLLL